MKTKVTLIVLALLMGVNTGYAQQDEECMTWLQIFAPYAKSKRYDEAYEPWSKLRNKCPKFNQAIYAYADNILEYKIENSTGEEKKGHINDLIKAYGQYNEYFASKMPTGEMLVEQAKLMYDYRTELGLTELEVYNKFDEAFKTDKDNFTDPKGLYMYFSLMVSLYDDGKKEAQELFTKYDDINEMLETQVAKYTKSLNKIIEKEESGATLSKREGQIKRRDESYLNAYDQIIESVEKLLGDRADCETLVPLYEKNYESNKDDKVWLQSAMNLMYNKGCKDDPLFLKLVEQKNKLEPSSDTSMYLYILTGEEKYFQQTVQLESDPLKKAKLYKKIANDYKSKGNYGKARQNYREALKLNPSDGSPYIQIAIMYANSANNCGDTNFNKRAVFWLAAIEAEKAGRVDPRLSKSAAQYAANYRAKAPSKSEIFSAGNSGQTISIGCWIGASVVVP